MYGPSGKPNPSARRADRASSASALVKIADVPARPKPGAGSPTRSGSLTRNHSASTVCWSAVATPAVAASRAEVAAVKSPRRYAIVPNKTSTFGRAHCRPRCHGLATRSPVPPGAGRHGLGSSSPGRSMSRTARRRAGCRLAQAPLEVRGSLPALIALRRRSEKSSVHPQRGLAAGRGRGLVLRGRAARGPREAGEGFRLGHREAAHC